MSGEITSSPALAATAPAKAAAAAESSTGNTAASFLASSSSALHVPVGDFQDEPLATSPAAIVNDNAANEDEDDNEEEEEEVDEEEAILCALEREEEESALQRQRAGQHQPHDASAAPKLLQDAIKRSELNFSDSEEEEKGALKSKAEKKAGVAEEGRQSPQEEKKGEDPAAIVADADGPHVHARVSSTRALFPVVISLLVVVLNGSVALAHTHTHASTFVFVNCCSLFSILSHHTNH